MRKILFLVLIAQAVWAQQPNVNPNNNNGNDMKKYWFYRTKLVNDFMMVGAGPKHSDGGYSLAFNRRAKYAPTISLSSDIIEMGDEISTLGYYIGVLATEYRLLADNGQDLTKVCHELYCALNAVNRLDVNAEYALTNSSGWTPSSDAQFLNGFLMRDDMSPYFVRDHYNHFNYFNHGTHADLNDGHPAPNEFPTGSGNFGNFDKGFASIAQHGQATVNSNYTDYLGTVASGNPDKSDIYMSQDHVINLLFGLSFVNALVDGTAKDGSNDQLYDPGHPYLRDAARRITDRIVHYVGQTSNWKIKDPITGTPLTNYQGGNALLFSYPLAEIGCIATGNGTSTTACSGCPAPTACNTYHDWYTKTGGFLAWQTINGSAATSNDNASMIAQLDAACNCIYSTVASHVVNQITQVLTKIWDWLGWFWGWVTSIITTIVSYFIPILNTNDTNDGMEANVEYWDYQYAPFARRLIHGGGAAAIPPQNVLFHGKPGYQYMNDLLDEAPCDGTWNVGGIYEVYDWSSPSMLDHPEQRGNHGAVAGEYNGLDYMLYHNIWRLYHNRYMSGTFKMIDLSDRIIKDNFPLGSGLGSVSTPIEIDAFETVEMSGQVNANANVTIKAGKTIHNPPGWHAVGIYHAFPSQPFGCSSNAYTGSFQARQTQDSLATNTQPSGFDYIHADMGIIKTHEINHSPEILNYKPQEPVEVDNSAAIKTKLNQATPNYQEAITKAVIKSELEENTLNILPNPNNGIFKIKLPTANRNNTMDIWVYDMAGNLIVSKERIKKWPETEDIDISENGSGSYLLRILTEDGKHFTKKLIVK